MRLARAALADEHHRLTSTDVSTIGQLAHPRRRYPRRLPEVELFQRLHPRQLRIANPVLNRMPVPLFALHRQQCFQVVNMAVILLHRLFGQREKVGRDYRHADGFAILPHAGVVEAFGRALHWMPPGVSSRSYSSNAGIGRSNCANSSANAIAYCFRCSASGMFMMCSTAAASLAPSRSASSTAAIKRLQPDPEPARTSVIISRVPPLLP